MRVAIPLYQNRVAPRFGFASEFLLVELKSKQEVDRQTLRLEVENPERVAEHLAHEGVDLVLSGGMNMDYQREFRLRNIGVIWGVIGEAEDVLAAFLRGKLYAGMGPCPPAKKRTSTTKKR